LPGTISAFRARLWSLRPASVLRISTFTRIAVGARNLTAFAAEAYRLAGLCHTVTPNSPDILVYLRLLARAIGADAARRAPGSAPVEVDLGKTGPIAVPRTDERPPALLRLRDVVDAYHAAFAAGDRLALALLASAPLDRVTAVPPQPEERVYTLPHAEGLQMLAQHVDGAIDMLLKAIRGCESPDMIPVARDAARLHASPEIELALLHGKSDREAHRWPADIRRVAAQRA
jgi:hypothetical protein